MSIHGVADHNNGCLFLLRCFCVLSRYWGAGAAKSDTTSIELDTRGDEPMLDASEFIEPLSAEAKAKVAIRIRGLTKIFNQGNLELETRAVDNLNLDIIEDQIHALLGHNGAGKSKCAPRPSVFCRGLIY